MSNITEAAQLIDRLGLQPHPEGGWYAECYRSADILRQTSLAARYQGDRSVVTGIYFLLTSESFSAFHRLQSDEGWHFYAGNELSVYVISPKGELTVHQMGSRIEAGDTYQAWVPAGSWFGSRVAQPGAWALVGCTVAPGFDFEDFEMARREDLLRKFPDHADIIQALTRS
ncbi:MAG: cupin domain-containing protein [Chloroflexi bacterium AL-W]|nr:cupin domain-containing protein [Chloroflexi bacterium AL-W]